jgi:hypothetical protein
MIVRGGQYAFDVLKVGVPIGFFAKFGEHLESNSAELLNLLEDSSEKIEQPFRDFLAVADLGECDIPRTVEIDLQEQLVHQLVKATLQRRRPSRHLPLLEGLSQ